MKPIEHYLALPYSWRITPEECTDGSRCYVGRVVELPGCESHGDTADEARENLSEALRLYLASLIADDIEPPEPIAMTEGTGGATTAVWTIEEVDQAVEALTGM
jgi:predicted RNase H-like HicB family nuclease